MWRDLVHMAAAVLKVQVGEDVVGLISYDPMTVTQLALSMGAPLYFYGFRATLNCQNILYLGTKR